MRAFRLSEAGRAVAAASAPPPSGLALLAITRERERDRQRDRDRRERDSRPTCPDCTCFDCPRAKTASAQCDIHSPLDPARLITLLAEKKNYAEMILRRRAQLSSPAPTTAPTAAAHTTARDTSERDDQLASQMEALALLAEGAGS